MNIIGTFEEKITVFKFSDRGMVKYSLSLCIDYRDLIRIYNSKNEIDGCILHFNKKICELWSEANDRNGNFYLNDFAPKRFIDFGRQILGDSKLIIIKGMEVNFSLYLFGKIFCIKFRKTENLSNLILYLNKELQINDSYQIEMNIYLTNLDDYPSNVGDYIYQTNLDFLKENCALIIATHELFVRDDLEDKDSLAEQIEKRETNESLTLCRYRCERKFQLNLSYSLYLDEYLDIKLDNTFDDEDESKRDENS